MDRILRLVTVGRGPRLFDFLKEFHTLFLKFFDNFGLTP